MDWTVRPYEPGDEEGVLALWNLVFGKSMSVGTWRWKFMGRPSAVANVWVAIDRDGRVIGHYAGVPLWLKVDRIVSPAFSSADAMTHPDFRRRGVSTALLRAAHATWGAAGATVAIGLPNEKLGTWRSLATDAFGLRWMRLPLRLDEVLRRPGRMPGSVQPLAASLIGVGSRLGRRSWPRSSASTKVVRVGDGSFDWSDLDVLWETVGPLLENCVVRDSSWWRWRFADCPSFRYHVLVAYVDEAPAGAAALRVHDEAGVRRGVIAELFGRPRDRAVSDSLVRASLDELWDFGAGTVHALAPVRSELASTLAGYGFRPRPESFDYMFIPLTEAGNALSRDPRTWHMTGAEFDIV